MVGHGCSHVPNLLPRSPSSSQTSLCVPGFHGFLSIHGETPLTNPQHPSPPTPVAVRTSTRGESHRAYSKGRRNSRIGPEFQTHAMITKGVAAAEQTKAGPFTLLTGNRRCVKVEHNLHRVNLARLRGRRFSMPVPPYSH